MDEKGWAYIDKSGRIVVRPLVVDNGPDYFREGLARFRRDGKVGFFDQRGRVAIQPGYAFDFENGRARVRASARWPYIGKDGKVAPQATLP